MIGLLQRVTRASVKVTGREVAGIATGILVFVAVERDDTESQAERLVQRILGYRMFADDNGRMNLDVRQIQGGVLLVPQFTLAADTRKGNRPGFSRSALPAVGEQLFQYTAKFASECYKNVECGVFGADMQVELVNDGPVTFWLQTKDGAG